MKNDCKKLKYLRIAEQILSAAKNTSGFRVGGEEEGGGGEGREERGERGEVGEIFGGGEEIWGGGEGEGEREG